MGEGIFFDAVEMFAVEGMPGKLHIIHAMQFIQRATLVKYLTEHCCTHFIGQEHLIVMV